MSNDDEGHSTPAWLAATPRTDQWLRERAPKQVVSTWSDVVALADFARDLERELSEDCEDCDHGIRGGAPCGSCGGCGRVLIADLLKATQQHVKELKGSTPSSESTRLWLWKNFVDGRPEYWAFDNPYPCHPNGDPMTLGEPCGYAIVKPSTRGRKDVSDEQVIAAIKLAKP